MDLKSRLGLYSILCSRSLYHYYVRRYSPGEETSPLELVQSLLSGRLAPGAHVIITSRPHTLTYLQVIYMHTLTYLQVIIYTP